MELDDIKKSSDYSYSVREDMADFYDEILSYPPEKRSNKWSVSWSDLMMTMFIFFAVMYAFQTGNRDLMFGKGPGKNNLSNSGSQNVLNIGVEQSPSNLYNQTKQAVSEIMVTKPNSVDLMKDGAVRIVLAGDLLFDPGKADLKIGMGHNPQEKDGLDFLDHMMEKYAIKKENLSLTGQSLGGILAQSIGTMTKIRTFAFNPYGTEGLIKEEIDDAHREFADENVFTVSHTHDQLSNFLTTAMTSHVGKVVEINGGEEENPHMREGHSIQRLNRLIEKITEEYGLETLEDLEAYNASFKKNTLVNKVTSFVDAAYKQVKVQKEAAKEKEEAQEPQKAETSQESAVKKIITFFKESYDEVQEAKEAKKEKKKNRIRHKQAFHEAP